MAFVRRVTDVRHNVNFSTLYTRCQNFYSIFSCSLNKIILILFLSLPFWGIIQLLCKYLLSDIFWLIVFQGQLIDYLLDVQRCMININISMRKQHAMYNLVAFDILLVTLGELCDWKRRIIVAGLTTVANR